MARLNDTLLEHFPNELFHFRLLEMWIMVRSNVDKLSASNEVNAEINVSWTGLKIDPEISAPSMSPTVEYQSARQCLPKVMEVPQHSNL